MDPRGFSQTSARSKLEPCTRSVRVNTTHTLFHVYSCVELQTARFHRASAIRAEQNSDRALDPNGLAMTILSRDSATSSALSLSTRAYLLFMLLECACYFV